MRRGRIVLIIFLWILLVIPSLALQERKAASRELKPIELEDILAWKSIQNATLSNDGQWFAYRLSPNKGDSEVIIKETRGKNEYRFPAGEAPPPPRFDMSAREDIFFSEDSKWLAFTIYPKSEDAKKLRKQKKKVYDNVGLMNLLTGKKIEFEKVKKFGFSGENPAWIALHKYPSEGQEKEKEKWIGSDLILYELASSKEYNIGNVSEFSFDKKGRWLAWIIDAQEKSGNGVQIRNMITSTILSLDSDKAVYKQLNWTEKGDALAVLKGKEDKNFEDNLFSVMGFTNFSSELPQKAAYEPREDKNFPEGMKVSPNRSPIWTEDLEGILFGIHELKEKEERDQKEKGKPEDKNKETDETKAERETDEDIPDLVIWHWLDRKLQSMQQVQEKADKDFSYLCIFRVKENKFLRLADEEVRNVESTPKNLWAIGLDKREYELMGNLDGRVYQDVYIVDLKTGNRRLAVKKCRWYYGPSPDGRHFLYYNDGHFFTYDMASSKVYNITKDVPTSFINEEDDHNVVKPPIQPVGWVKDGVSALLYDNWDVWNVPVHGGGGVNLTVNGKKEAIRYQRRFVLDPEEKGIDLSGSVYFSVYGEWTKKGGVAMVERGMPGVRTLLWGDALFRRLLKAKKASIYLYTKESEKDYPDYYISDQFLQGGLKITNSNPQQKEILWSEGSLVINYESAKGDKLQANLFLPANYEKGKSYPTIVYIYEKLSQGRNQYNTPSVRGFNKSIYTSWGYVVLMPDIVYRVNDPGMSSAWCVLPAIEAAIATGVVDRNKVGIHGHSWGGYQTAFLITQSDIFKAAVAGAPLTNMVSMYSSIYWNSGSTNQPIFESSQGRLTGGYWENPEAYVRNSPVYFAQNVKTPLMLMHCDKDGAVDWNQGIEYYNTLRRLKKPVVMLQYVGENHSLQKPANQKDYTIRMKEFFDHYLMGKPAPKWLQEGIPHLKMKEHLEERTEVKKNNIPEK